MNCINNDNYQLIRFVRRNRDSIENTLMIFNKASQFYKDNEIALNREVSDEQPPEHWGWYSIAYYISYWDTKIDEDAGEKMSHGHFLSVKPEERGKGLGVFLYILNAELALNNGLETHEADFAVINDPDNKLSSQEKNLIFQKLYGKIGMTRADSSAMEMKGSTRMMTGLVARRAFCSKFIKKFPNIYNVNCDWCRDIPGTVGGKRKTHKRKYRKRKYRKRKTCTKKYHYYANNRRGRPKHIRTLKHR